MKKPSDFKTKIAGQDWSFIFVRKGHPKIPEAYGMCYWEEREIYIRYDLQESSVRMLVIHETLHATCHLLFVAEEWVDHTSFDINDALHKSGL